MMEKAVEYFAEQKKNKYLCLADDESFRVVYTTTTTQFGKVEVQKKSPLSSYLNSNSRKE